MKKVSFSYLTAALTPAATGKYPSKYDSICGFFAFSLFSFHYNFFPLIMQQKNGVYKFLRTIR